MNKADAQRITTTGEMRTDEKCPCCGEAIYNCDCSLIMTGDGYFCTVHSKEGAWEDAQHKE